MKNGNACGAAHGHHQWAGLRQWDYGKVLTGPTSGIAWVLAFSETTTQ